MIGGYINPQRRCVKSGRIISVALMLMGISASPVWAQDPHAGHAMSPPATSAEKPHDVSGAEPVTAAAQMAEEVMPMGSMGSMQGGPPPPDARDPHAYADGFDFGPYKLELADTHSLGSLLVDNLETVRSDGNSSTAYDLQAWFGRPYDRLVFKAEGDIDGNQLQEARSELLWGHAIAAYWDGQIGLRYDSGEGPNRNWLAFGVQGLAPYWFEVDATGYIGESGRTALRLDASYELLFTQKIILQPRIEANAYGQGDRERGLGSGLADLSVQLRLRYEIGREFAPYIGVEWVRLFGKTEEFARAAGEDANDVRFVAGLRFWF